MSDIENEDMELDLVEMTDTDGNTITMLVEDYFFYNGDEYAILSEYDEEAEEADTDEPLNVDCYVMKVVSYEEDGEEYEEFEPIEDVQLEDKLMKIAAAKLDEEDTSEE